MDRKAVCVRKVIIASGDRYAKGAQWRRVVRKELEARLDFDGDRLVIHGDAPGIDTIVHEVMKNHFEDVGVVPLPAQWESLGKPAGPRRNEAMRSIALILRAHGWEIEFVGFHNTPSISKGTKNMGKLACEESIPGEFVHSDFSREPLI